MARMLRARARSFITPRRVGKLPIFLPIFASAWRARSRLAGERHTLVRSAAWARPQLLGLSGRQAASVGILTQRIQCVRFPRRQPSCFAGRHVWKR